LFDSVVHHYQYTVHSYHLHCIDLIVRALCVLRDQLPSISLPMISPRELPGVTPFDADARLCIDELSSCARVHDNIQYITWEVSTYAVASWAVSGAKTLHKWYGDDDDDVATRR
jgi:hypothetical protein